MNNNVNPVLRSKVDEIRNTFNSLKWAVSNGMLSPKKSENEQYEFLSIFKNFIYRSIHEDLDKDNNDKNGEKEKLIRELVKYVIKTLLPAVRKKTDEYSYKIQNKKITSADELQMANNWLDLEDDYSALSAFRSLTCLALYLERDDALDQLVWKYIMKDVMGGIFYYANAMILNNQYQNMFKQCPTGYGKSKSDCVIICYIFGYNPNASVFKVVGNPSVAGDVFENVVKMLKSKRFGKVFPKFGKCEGNEKKMFKTLKQSDGEFLLNGSKKARSFFCVNKETSIDGTRYDYQFYDDVTQSKDRENISQHKKDIKNYTGQWRKRASNEYDVKRFFTGTAYHAEDFISYAKRLYANGRPLIKDISTMMYAWSKFVKLSEDKKSVYVIVPKLADLDLGEEKCYCTFPQKFSKEVAIQMLHGNLGDKREFYAMEQQAPLPPESLIFDWAYLNTYNELPQDILDNDCECRAIIDPARKGNDFFCCLIFKKSNTINVDKWYLVYCFYQKVNAKKALPDIAKKIKKHMVDIIYLENNIDYEDLLDERLKDISYYDYEIISFYSTEKKSEKISKQQDDIRDLIVFPSQRMYHYESEMGRGLTELTTYSDEIKVAHDDFTDCCAMFTIQIQGDIENSVEVLNINFTFR